MERELKRDQKEEKARMDEAQRLAARTAEIEGVYTMGFNDKLDVDKAKIPWGWEYYWGRQYSQGFHDNARMAYLGRMGWTPVPPERHPELCFGSSLAGESSPQYIYVDGLILLERPITFGDRERAQLNKHNMRIETEMPGRASELSEVPDPRRGPSTF